MARVRSLARPPITEALVDIRATLSPVFRAETFRAAYDLLKDDYPKQEEMRQFQAMFEFKQGKALAPETSDIGLVGFRFISSDGRNVAQFRTDGFTYNRLAPYSGWQQIKPEALRLWAIYVEIAKPQQTNRVALRYINRIDLPSSGSLNEHIEVAPPVFPGAPPVVTEYVLRLSSADPASGNRANISQALEVGTAPSRPTLLLDIDAYNATPQGVSATELGPILDNLRTIKNEIFFGVITEHTAQRYQ